MNDLYWHLAGWLEYTATLSGVDHQVDVSQHVVESVRAVVDDLMGADVANERNALTRHGGTDSCTGPTRELHCEVADATRPGMDEHMFAGPDPPLGEECLPGR